MEDVKKVENENVTIRMNPDLHTEVKTIASQNGISMSSWIIDAITKQLQIEKNVPTEKKPESGQGSGENGSASPDA